MPPWSPCRQRFFPGASHVIVIGSQNAFALRQGRSKDFVFTIGIICFLCDAILIRLGIIAGQDPEAQRPFFATGAATASMAWFCGLSYGVRILTLLIRKQLAWKILDILIGAIMWGIAFRSVFHGE